MSSLEFIEVGNENDEACTADAHAQLPCCSRLLNVEVEIREKIYEYLTEEDFRTLRLVCDQLRIESEYFGTFSVYMKQGHPPLEIPFRRIGELHMKNNEELLPWGNAEGDTLDRLNCTNASFATLSRLGKLATVKEVTLRYMVFTRSVPEFNWPRLHSLFIKYFVPMGYSEACMLDNLDSLMEQSFPTLTTFSISLSNAEFATKQSKYSLLVACFVSNHWKTLKNLSVTFEARGCVPRLYVPSPNPKITGLQDQELENFLRLQLSSFELNISEMSCPKCSIWKLLLQKQRALEVLNVHVSSAEMLPSDFFCDIKAFDQFTQLKSLTIQLWGQGSYHPIDFKYFASAKNLSSFDLSRYTDSRIQVTRTEVLNVQFIPENIHLFSLTGYLIESSDIPTIFNKLKLATSIILLDCGSGVDLGFTSCQLSSLEYHPSLTYALIDFNTEHPDTNHSVVILKSLMDTLVDLGFKWRHLYDLGFDKHHRFEFCRLKSQDEIENDRDYPLSVRRSKA